MSGVRPPENHSRPSTATAPATPQPTNTLRRDGATSAYSVVASPAWVEPGDLVCTTRISARVPVAPDRIDQLLPSTTTGGPTPMHCDLVVSVDLSRRVARAIGGNVMQGVTMRKLKLNAEGRLTLPMKRDADAARAFDPRDESTENMNRQDWAALLKLNRARVR